MESNAIALLKEAGKRGLLLSELAKQLEQPATKVLKIVESLETNGQVEKKDEEHNGKSVLRLFWREEDSKWDTLQGCPCFSCTEIDKCGASQSISPWTCEKLNIWIKEQLAKS